MWKTAVSVLQKFTNTSQVVRQCSSSPGRSDGRGFRETGLNEVQLLGRVGKDPEVRGNQSSENKNLVIFPLVTNRFWKNADGEINDRADWHRIVVGLPSQKNIALNYVQKGDRVLIKGSLYYKAYVSEHKVTNNVTYINATRVMIMKKAFANRRDDPESSSNWNEEESSDYKSGEYMGETSEQTRNETAHIQTEPHEDAEHFDEGKGRY